MTRITPVFDVGYQTLHAQDGMTAIDLSVQRSPDLILMDMTMPGRDGIETCRTLKSQRPTKSVPVIFVTAHSDSGHVVPAFEAGGCDYVSKPIRIDEILARVAVHLELHGSEVRLQERNERLESLSGELAETNAELARQARIDELTSLLNRRAWDESAELEQERSGRYGHVFSVLMLDVDFFKAFNDSQGHQAGDQCLRLVAQGIRSTCRTTDPTGRFGGEEFVVLAPETDPECAAQLAERVRHAIWALGIAHPESPAGRVTVSVGVATNGGEPLGETLRKADAALYSAKKCGRNLVYTSDGMIPSTVQRSAATGPDAPSPDKPVSPAAPRVLIVEDNDTNRMVYKACLAKENYRIDEVENGQTALHAVAKDLPDVIIMDVMMPVMDGLECTRRLKNSAETRDVPIIIVSARSDPAEIVEGLKAGADEYLTKPIRTTELVVRVRSMARLSRERRDLLRSYQIRAEQNGRGRNRVLLVEDNVVNRRVATGILRKCGCDVVEEEHGRIAIERLERESFDMVFMDVQMPEMDGFEATRLIRAEDRWKRLPIIAMTAHAMKGDRERCLDAGMNDYITKPVSMDRVQEIVHKWCPSDRGVPMNQAATVGAC